MPRKPRITDPVAMAKRAMAEVLSRAVASQDDDRILASAKQVLSMLDKPDAERKPQRDSLDVSTLNEEELVELDALLDQLDCLKDRVASRIAGAPQAARVAAPIAPPVEPPIAEPPTDPELEPGEYIDADGKHWWRDPDDPNSEPIEYAGDDE